MDGLTAPAPTLAEQLAYLRQRIAKAESGPVTLCRRDLEAVKALLAEVERQREVPSRDTR